MGNARQRHGAGIATISRRLRGGRSPPRGEDCGAGTGERDTSLLFPLRVPVAGPKVRQRERSPRTVPDACGFAHRARAESGWPMRRAASEGRRRGGQQAPVSPFGRRAKRGIVRTMVPEPSPGRAGATSFPARRTVPAPPGTVAVVRRTVALNVPDSAGFAKREGGGAVQFAKPAARNGSKRVRLFMTEDLGRVDCRGISPILQRHFTGARTPRRL